MAQQKETEKTKDNHKKALFYPIAVAAMFVFWNIVGVTANILAMDTTREEAARKDKDYVRSLETQDTYPTLQFVYDLDSMGSDSAKESVLNWRKKSGITIRGGLSKDDPLVVEGGDREYLNFCGRSTVTQNGEKADVAIWGATGSACASMGVALSDTVLMEGGNTHKKLCSSPTVFGVDTEDCGEPFETVAGTLIWTASSFITFPLGLGMFIIGGITKKRTIARIGFVLALYPIMYVALEASYGRAIHEIFVKVASK